MAEKTCWVFFAGAGARCEGVLAGLAIDAVGRVVAAHHRVVLSGLAIDAVGRVVAARHRVVLSRLAIDANIVLEELACRTILWRTTWEEVQERVEPWQRASF